MTECALAVDLGGTELRSAIVDRGGRIDALATTATRAQDGPEAVIEQIAAAVDRLRAAAGERSVLGLGVGAPGPLDPVAGIAIGPPTLAGWQDVPLAALLRQRLGIEVRIENDANAAALGEWRFGAGRGTRSLVFVTVSTGLGGGVIADGRLLHGRRGLAAEIGHMTIADGSEDACFCGVRGCWEALASGTALGLRPPGWRRPARRRCCAGSPAAGRSRAATWRRPPGRAIPRPWPCSPARRAGSASASSTCCTCTRPSG